DQRNVAGRRLAIRGVDSRGKADVRFASNDADAGQLQRRARAVVEDDYVTRGNALLFDRIDAVAQHRAAVDIEHDDLDVTHDPSDRGKWSRTNNGTRSARPAGSPHAPSPCGFLLAATHRPASRSGGSPAGRRHTAAATVRRARERSPNRRRAESSRRGT